MLLLLFACLLCYFLFLFWKLNIWICQFWLPRISPSLLSLRFKNLGNCCFVSIVSKLPFLPFSLFSDPPTPCAEVLLIPGQLKLHRFVLTKWAELVSSRQYHSSLQRRIRGCWEFTCVAWRHRRGHEHTTSSLWVCPFVSALIQKGE